MKNVNGLADEEKVRLARREVIEKNDSASLGSAAGWKRRQQRKSDDVDSYVGGVCYGFTGRREEQAIGGKKNETVLVNVRAYVEAERFYDARAFALLLLGVSSVVCTRAFSNGLRPTPRWQVRSVGSAMDPRDMPRREARVLRADESITKWVREGDAQPDQIGAPR